MSAIAPEPVSQVDADQFAALDLGSNSFHLLVASYRTGRIQVIDKLKEMVRLADGLDAKGSLSPVATQRALECLERFGQRLQQLPTNHVRVVGTSTLRQAKNGQQFLAAAEQALGHSIEIISGLEEARLIYQGVANDLSPNEKTRLVIDIGGGSTELIVGQQQTPDLVDSLHMGCVNVSRAYFADGQLTRKNFDAAIAFAQQEAEPVTEQYANAGWQQAIGASGSILATAAVAQQLPGRPTDRGDALEQADLEDLINHLIEIGSNERLRLPGLGQDRAPVFAGGVAIIAGLMRSLNITQLSTSQGALREGLLLDLLGREDNRDMREQTVADLLDRFHIDKVQAQRVKTLAQELLRQVGPTWGLVNEQDQRKLGWGALLHEIGMTISHSAYHKHGSYLIANLDLPGFSREEQRGLALIIRAHRRKFPKEEFRGDDPRLLRLQRLAILLRIATLMHRSRTGQLPPKISLEADDKSLTLTLDEGWLEQHPLTRLDLAQEASYLANTQCSLLIVAS